MRDGGRNLKTYHKMLLQKKAELLSRLDVVPVLPGGAEHVAAEDQAQQAHEEFISLSLNEIEHDLLKGVEAALERLEAGGFGKCLACGGPIPRARLRALPWASYCLPCEDRIESLRPVETPEGPALPSGGN
jgi:DnaK suppressor protein